MEKKSIYFECYSGISGDMTVAALLDLGASEEKLRKVLSTIPVGGFEVVISRVKKSGIDVCDFDVILQYDNHDHDMEYLHSHHDHDCGHVHKHVHNGLNEILDIISKTEMSDNAKKIASDIFNVLAKAEAVAHNVDISDVHFHEVGAVDSIVDIISVAVCIDDLNIGEVYASELYEGVGTIRCQHGIIPVPVPAVSNIVSSYNLKMHATDVHGELITPTGAAILAALNVSQKLPEIYSIEKIGMGAGKREYKTAGMLRVMCIK